jgi:hypothetical protein
MIRLLVRPHIGNALSSPQSSAHRASRNGPEVFDDLDEHAQHLEGNERIIGAVRIDAIEQLDANDLDTVRADLLNVISRAVEPAHAAIWISPARATRAGSPS